MRFVDSHYRTQADRAHRGIGGLSMGGYGALSVALHFPDVFSAAASHSGVVSPMYVGPHPFVAPPQYATEADIMRPAAAVYWSRYKTYWGTDLERWRAADPAREAELLQRHGGRMPSIFIDCGTEDALLDQNRALHDELDATSRATRLRRVAGRAHVAVLEHAREGESGVDGREDRVRKGVCATARCWFGVVGFGL